MYVMQKIEGMRIPKFHGRPMKLVEKTDRLMIFIDEKTGIKECFTMWDLTHVEYTGRLYELEDEKGNTGHNKVRGARPFANRTKNKDDNRLSNLIDQMKSGAMA